MTLPSVYLKPFIWVLQGVGAFPYSWPDVDPSHPWNPKISVPLILWCIVIRVIVLIQQTTKSIRIMSQFQKGGQNVGDLVYLTFNHLFEILGAIVNAYIPFCGRYLVRIFQVLNSLSEDTRHVPIATDRQFLEDNSKQLLKRVVWKIDWLKVILVVFYPFVIVMYFIAIMSSQDSEPVMTLLIFISDIFGVAMAVCTFMLFRLVFPLLAEYLQENIRKTVMIVSLGVDRVSTPGQNKASERTAMILLNRLEILISKVSWFCILLTD